MRLDFIVLLIFWVLIARTVLSHWQGANSLLGTGFTGANTLVGTLDKGNG